MTTIPEMINKAYKTPTTFVILVMVLFSYIIYLRAEIGDKDYHIVFLEGAVERSAELNDFYRELTEEMELDILDNAALYDANLLQTYLYFTDVVEMFSTYTNHTNELVNALLDSIETRK